MPPLRCPSRLACAAAVLLAAGAVRGEEADAASLVVAPGAASAGETVVAIGDAEPELVRTDAEGRTTAADQRLELDERSLAAAGVMGLEDLDRYDPRIDVVEDRTRGGISDIRVRGLGGSRVLVTMDGVPLADAPAGRGYVDPNLLSGLSVTFGPGSAREGSDAVAGTVDFRTLQPDDLVAPGETRVLARGFASTLDRTTGLHARAASAGDDLAALVAATAQRQHETTAVGRARIAPQVIDTLSALGSVRIALHPDWNLTASADGYRADSDTALTDDLLVQRDADDQRRRWKGALATDGGPAEDVRIRARLAWQETASDEETTTRDFRMPSGVFNRTAVARSGFEQRQLAGSASVAIGRPEERLLRVGIDGRYAHSADLQSGSTTTVAPAMRLSDAPTRSFPVSESLTGGLSGEWHETLPDPHWAIEAGGRVDAYRLDVATDAAYARSLAGQNAPVDLQDAAPTGRAAVLWSPHDDQAAYAKVATGYRNGRFDEANQAFTNFANGYTISPNPDLAPERSIGVEAGWRSGGRIGYELTAHQTWYRDFIATEFVGTVPNIPGIGPFPTLAQYQSVNIDSVEIHGIDARLDADIAGGLFSRAAASWIEGRDRSTGDPIDDLDPLHGYGSLGWRSEGGRIRVEAFARFAGRKREVADGTAFVPPGWTAFDLRAAWTVNDHLSIDAAWVNVLDAHYWTWSDVRSLHAGASEADRDFYASDAGHLTCSLTNVW